MVGIAVRVAPNDCIDDFSEHGHRPVVLPGTVNVGTGLGRGHRVAYLCWATLTRACFRSSQLVVGQAGAGNPTDRSTARHGHTARFLMSHVGSPTP